MEDAKRKNEYEAITALIQGAKHISKDRRAEMIQACHGICRAQRTIQPEEKAEWFALHAHRGVYMGAIGGHITLTTCYTSIGDINTYRCSVCGEEAYVAETL